MRNSAENDVLLHQWRNAMKVHIRPMGSEGGRSVDAYVTSGRLCAGPQGSAGISVLAS
jgi:hypothetical protein